MADWTGRLRNVVTNDSFALNWRHVSILRSWRMTTPARPIHRTGDWRFAKSAGAAALWLCPGYSLLNGVELQKIMDHAPIKAARCWCRMRRGEGQMQPGGLRAICSRCALEMTVSCSSGCRRSTGPLLAWCWNCRALRAMSIVPKISRPRPPRKTGDRRPGKSWELFRRDWA